MASVRHTQTKKRSRQQTGNRAMAGLINVYDILNAKYLVLDKEALAVIEEVFA